MKITDAFWEKRNLGIESCYEVTIERQDSPEQVREKLSTLNAEYMVVKVPAGKTDVMFLLNRMGYSFIECLFHVTHDLKSHETAVRGVLKRMLAAVEYAKMDKSDVAKLFSEIEQGLFDTDRVYLDPAFSPKQAANRYIGWIGDEIERGCDLYKLIYKDQSIGFFTFKDLGEGVYFPFLAGMYRDFQQGGLGLSNLYYSIVEAKKRQGKQISTFLSTNNTSIVRTHVFLNYYFAETSYVYVKHN